jgi:glycosyltransferase involved in cell wall biosynthesis
VTSVAPKRVMMIAPHFEEYAYLLAVALARHVDVLLVLDKAALDREFIGRPMPRHGRLEVRNNRFRTAAELARLFADMRRFRPDVVHWQEPSGFVKAAFAAATLTAARPFARTAITIHDPVPHVGRDWRVAARLARLRRYARGRVHRLFLHGPACAEQYHVGYLGSAAPDPRVRLTRHGAMLQGPGTSLPPARFRAVMIGRMEAYKGLEILIDALERLAAAGQRVAIEIAGAGPELDRLHGRLAALPDVTVTNRYIPARELIELIGASDCVLLPYLEASQSGVLAAAFANRRFVIASAVGGIVDLVEEGENGLLVPPGDAAALAAAIARAAGDEALRDRLRAGAGKTLDAQLGWDEIAAGLLADY